MRKRFIRISALVLVLLLCIAPSGAVGESDSFLESCSPFIEPDKITVGYTGFYSSESTPIIIRLSYTDEKGTEVSQEYTDTTPNSYSTYVIASRNGLVDETLDMDNKTFYHRGLEPDRQYTVYAYSADRSLSHGPVVYIHNLISEDQPSLILDYVDGRICIWPRYSDNTDIYFDFYRLDSKGKPELIRSDVPAGQLPSDRSVVPGETYTYYVVAKTGKNDIGIQSEMLSITIPEATAP
ncbi:MAG: hypothetical protein IKK75_05525 [Clostridia bacterium]|nr:hypothetical protein [Clostridia bacterium]